GGAGSESRDWVLVAPRPQLAAHLKPVERRHHDVENHHVGTLRLALIQRFLPVCGEHNGVTVENQGTPQRFANSGVIVHNENLHIVILPSRRVFVLTLSTSLGRSHPQVRFLYCSTAPCRRLSSVTEASKNARTWSAGTGVEPASRLTGINPGRSGRAEQPSPGGEGSAPPGR